MRNFFFMSVLFFVLLGCPNPNEEILPSTPEVPSEEGDVPAVKIFTVTFETNGGSPIPNQTPSEGEKVQRPKNPEKANSWFIDWYGDEKCETLYDFNKTVESDITIYAQWADLPTNLTDYKSPSGTEGRYLSWGEWPQTIKAAEVTITEETKEAGLFTYYKGDDNHWYVKVEEDAYPFDSMSGFTYSDGTPVNKKNTENPKTLYFKVEPIVWKILKEDLENKKALIISDIIIERVLYYVSTNNRTIDGKTIYPNNYQYSQARAFLMGTSFPKDDGTNDETYNGKGFLQTAFSKGTQSLILETSINDVNDKVFLLNHTEACMSEYGFPEEDVTIDFDNDENPKHARLLKVTDYLKARGIYYDPKPSFGQWWLRNDKGYDSEYVYGVGIWGNANGTYTVSESSTSGGNLGIVAALWMQLQ